jgi:penicillin-binding protein 2
MRQVREQREDLLQRLPRLQWVIVALLILIAGRFWFVQGVQGDFYRELAENNRMRQLPLKAPRGLIFERHGRLLAENVPSYNLLIDRSRCDDLPRALEFAAATLEQPVDELQAALDRQRGASLFQPVLIAEGLSLSEVARFEVVALEYPEFEVEVGQLRLYRYGPVTAHSLGYLGEISEEELGREDSPYRAGDLVGKKGIEKFYEDVFRGTDGERVVIVDSHGRLREEYSREAAVAGSRLDLGLDLDLQQEATRYFESKAGAVVGLDPVSGEIRVLVSAPSYNPNLFSRRLDREAWQKLLEAPHDPLQNRVIQNTYAPGSVFKIVMAIAGLSEQEIRPQETVYCRGATRIYNRRFRCWKRGGHGRVDLRRAIKESCDVYFYHLGQSLGISRISHYARLLGLGRPTGIDLAGEKGGLVPDAEWALSRRGSPWYPGETISVAIGQGPVLVTPLQVASLLATVANGGYSIKPYQAVGGAGGRQQPVGVAPEILERVRDALWAVVNEMRGTGAVAKLPGVAVAGKTGTVQVIRQQTWIESDELPYEQRDHAWFASFATAGEEQLVVVVLVEHGGRGSRAAAPLAKRLYEIYFRDHIDGRQPS